MITFARCKEIFADKGKFELTNKGGGINYTRVTMRHLAKNGEHYDFGFRLRPNGFNDCAEVFFGKWTPMSSYVVCHNICDEGFLLELIRQCHEFGNY